MDRPRKILLTGATGFVGTHLCSALAERWPSAEIVGLSADAVPGIGRANLLDRDAIDAAVAATAPDIVIHLAAQASVATAERKEEATWAVNLGGTLNLATAVAAHVPDALFLFASSAEVYGASFLTGPAHELTPLLPTNAYARSKAHAERVLFDVLAPFTRLIVARPFNHTGIGQRENFVLPSFVGQIARIEAGQQPGLLVGNIDVRRDFLDVRDVVAAYIALLEAAPSLPHRFACNIASEAAVPLRDHVETLRALANCAVEIAVDPTRIRPVDLPVIAGSAQLLRSVTSWVPRYSMKANLEEMLLAARRELTSQTPKQRPSALG